MYVFYNIVGVGVAIEQYSVIYSYAGLNERDYLEVPCDKTQKPRQRVPVAMLPFLHAVQCDPMFNGTYSKRLLLVLDNKYAVGDLPPIFFFVSCDRSVLAIAFTLNSQLSRLRICTPRPGAMYLSVSLHISVYTSSTACLN